MSVNRKYNPNWRHSSKQLIRDKGNKCHICRSPGTWRKPLQVHHRDYDTKNDSKKNLLVVCARCHGIITAHDIKTHRQLYLRTKKMEKKFNKLCA